MIPNFASCFRGRGGWVVRVIKVVRGIGVVRGVRVVRLVKVIKVIKVYSHICCPKTLTVLTTPALCVKSVQL